MSTGDDGERAARRRQRQEGSRNEAGRPEGVTPLAAAFLHRMLDGVEGSRTVRVDSTYWDVAMDGGGRIGWHPAEVATPLDVERAEARRQAFREELGYVGERAGGR